MSNTLDDFFAKHDWALLEQVNGWAVTRSTDNSDVIHFCVSGRDAARYKVRCECAGYPEEPPSVVFVNEGGSKMDLTAWPIGDAEFDQIVKPPPHCFLCTSLTREGLQHHNEWRNDESKNPWNGKKHTLLDVFNLVTRLLNDSHYNGRKQA